MCLGQFVGNLGTFSVDQRPLFIEFSKHGEADSANVFSQMDEKPYSSTGFRKIQCFVADFPLIITPSSLRTHFSTLFEKHTASLFIGSTKDGHTIAMVYKTDKRMCPADLKYTNNDGLETDPSNYVFRKGKLSIENTLQLIHKTCEGGTTNIAIVAPPKGVDYTFENIVGMTGSLTEEQIITIRGKCNAVHWKHRTGTAFKFRKGNTTDGVRERCLIMSYQT